jgi:hypothetical protein
MNISGGIRCIKGLAGYAGSSIASPLDEGAEITAASAIVAAVPYVGVPHRSSLFEMGGKISRLSFVVAVFVVIIVLMQFSPSLIEERMRKTGEGVRWQLLSS